VERERWAQVKQILGSCLDLELDQRASYLAQACAGDASLLAEVQDMLVSNAALGDFLETPVLGDPPGELLTGRQIGSYLLREPIAEGGMGTVYRAVRVADFEKNVAVKLVKRGMDTDFILRRFRHERQILAGLDHPHIARLLDGGATGDGRPYLVMEYIDGIPITEYSEQHHLGLPERLELFRTVCSAVQYAHQNLVVHRDLKTSNILVTASGEPKLLDFGIAKLLEPDADATMTSVRLLTPECASPEQVRGEPVTTATDIYSLGTLLYSLLTGEPPYRFSTRTSEEIKHLVCDVEPKKPSTVRPLPDDLDNIVLKAMHKEPARRYVSAEGLSEDIRRYLEGLPVSARKDTFHYRASKFVARHKAATGAAVLFALSLMAGMGATLWEAHLARIERTRAERRFNDVRKLANSLLFEIHDGIADLPGSTRVRKLLVDRAIEYLGSLAHESSGDASLQREIAAAYEKVGAVQGKYGAANLGDAAGALQSLEKALQIRQQVVAGNPSNSSDSLALASAYRAVATQLMVTGALSQALSAINQAVPISEQLLQHNHADSKVLEELSFEYEISGIVQQLQNPITVDNQGALLAYQKALAIAESRLKLDPGNESAKRAVETYSVHVGDGLRFTGDLKGCFASYQRALELAQALQSGSVAASRRRDLALVYNRLGLYYQRVGDRKRQLDANQQNRQIYVELAAADANNANAQWDLGNANLNLGGVLVEIGRVKDGLALMNQAVQIGETFAPRDPANSSQQGTLADYYVERAQARSRTGLLTEALEDLEKALVIRQKNLLLDPGKTAARLNVASTHSEIGRISVKAGLLDRATSSFQEALEISKPDLGTSPPNRHALSTSADSYSGLGSISAARASRTGLPASERLKQWTEARSFYQESLSTWRLMRDPSPVSIKQAEQQLAHCDLEMNKVRRTQ